MSSCKAIQAKGVPFRLNNEIECKHFDLAIQMKFRDWMYSSKTKYKCLPRQITQRIEMCDRMRRKREISRRISFSAPKITLNYLQCLRMALGADGNEREDWKKEQGTGMRGQWVYLAQNKQYILRLCEEYESQKGK